MTQIEDLKKRRKELKMTFEDLSKASGIPLRTLENIFHGVTKNPRIDTLQAIEKALGIEKTPPEENLSESEVELISLIKQLTDKEARELSNYVDFILSKRK